MSSRRIALILAGGGGTRLWPLSSDDEPKQLSTRLFPTPLITEAYERTVSILSRDDTYIFTTARLAERVREATGVPASRLLVEPRKKDTAAAFAFAAGYFSHEPGVTCATVNADHVVSGIPELVDALSRAYALASEGEMLVTIGTRPLEPKTELGYVLRGAPCSVRASALVSAFVEKPREEVARHLIAQGALLNSGTYVWTPDTLLSIMEEVAPELARGARSAGAAYRSGERTGVEAWYEAVPQGSFDRFVSEKTSRFAVVESAHVWKDVGTWQTFYEVSPKDEAGNVCLLGSGATLSLHDSRGCIVAPTRKNVVLLGVENLVVAESGENVLIARREEAHRIKDALQKESLESTSPRMLLPSSTEHVV